MPSNWGPRGVREGPNYGCESAGTPTHRDTSCKDDAFHVGTLGCEAEPIANLGKFESIRFRSRHNRRAAQSRADQAGRLRDRDEPDLLGIGEIQARLKQNTERNRFPALLCFKADQAAEWLRIRSLASNSIADLNLWKCCSASDQKIGDIRSICRHIGDRPACGNEFSKTSLTIFKMLTERPQSNCESGIGELHSAAVLLGEPTAFERGCIAQLTAFQLRLRREWIDLVHRSRALDLLD